MSNTTEHGTDDIIIGTAFTILCLIDLLPYIPCLIVIRTDKKLKKHSCFKLMFHLGLADLVLITGQSYAGIITMGGWGKMIPEMISRILGFFMFAAWKTYLIVLHLIAMNRFVHICLNARAKHLLFSNKIVKMWISLGWCYGLTWAMLIQPFTLMVYIPTFYTWHYVYGAAWVINLSWLFDICMVSLCVVYYVLIVLYLRFKVKVYTDEGQARLRAKERKILLQASIFGLYTYIHGQQLLESGTIFV